MSGPSCLVGILIPVLASPQGGVARRAIEYREPSAKTRGLGGGGRGAVAAGGGARGGGRGAWTPQRSIEQMDKFGIGVAILSLTQMGDVIYDNTEKGRAAVRKVNDFGAKCMHDYPKRFGL